MTSRRQAAIGTPEARTQGAGVAELRTRLKERSIRPPEARVGAGFRRQDALGARETRMQGAFVAALRMRLKTKYAAAKRGLGGHNLVPSRAHSAD
jgi:hypothetical protein